MLEPSPYPDPKSADFPYLKQLRWNTTDRFQIEAAMIRAGGKLVHSGREFGEGLAHHYKAAISALWPHFDWIPWSHLLIDGFSTEPEVAVLGPGSSGKTYTAAAFGLTMIWAWGADTTVMMSTTTKDSLDLRVWGSAMELIRKATQRRRQLDLPPLPGKVVASKYRFTTSESEDENLPEDKRDGIVGIACKVGDSWVGISNYVGLKNTRVVLIADEAHLMNQGFLDSIANLRNNPTFKLIALGNPKDPLDPLGKAAEPATEDGGWDTYVPEKRTKTWRTRNGGIAIQLCGLDSPNYRYGRGLNPYKHLITPEAIDKNIKDYGEDSIQVAMMSYGIMPRTGAVKRILDTLLCERHGAFTQPTWAASNKLTHVAFLDAAYSGIGGDRCVLTHLVFGPNVAGIIQIAAAEPQVIVPIRPDLKLEPEAQIRIYCSKFCEDRSIPPENFGFDSTGRGTLGVEFARNWSASIVPIEFGGMASRDRLVSLDDPRPEYEVYYNQVSAIWYSWRLTVLSGQFRNLPRPAVEEAQMRSWDIVKARGRGGAPLIQVEPKDEMKKRLGRSPDLGDSVAGAVEIARRRGFNIAGGFKVGVEARKTPDWLAERKKRYRETMRRHELQPV